jgi:hypothetical protein
MKHIWIFLFIFFPAVLCADWKDDLREQYKEEGYSRNEIKALIEQEAERRENAKNTENDEDDEEEEEPEDDSETEKKEVKRGDKKIEKITEAEARKRRTKGEDIEHTVVEKKKSPEKKKTDRDQWVADQLEVWCEDIKGKWPEKELNKRRSDYKIELRRVYGKDEKKVELAYEKYLLKRARIVSRSILKDKTYKDISADVLMEYKEFIFIPSSKRPKIISDLYFDKLEEIREERSKRVESSYKAALDGFELAWDDGDLTKGEKRAKQRSVKAIFDRMGKCVTKKEFTERLAKAISKSELSGKEKKMLKAALKDCVPAK